MKKPTPKHVFHLSRLVLFSLLAVALLVARSDSGNALHLSYNKNVLAYASNMTIADLLTATNASRAANNMKPLTLNSQLDTSAQLKANDMVEKNYWSHSSPFGVEPWYWFEQAGYSYSVAGENLAYGFGDGTEAETAWMNSPSHKANVLGDYADVGFGIASSANYQGGQYTVVVAHYGKPRQAESVATTSQPTAALSSATSASTTSTSASILDLVRAGSTPSVALVSIGLVAIAAAGFALTHRAYMKHAFREGKRFVVHHPLIDLTVFGVTVGFILTTTVGHLL